MIHSSLTGANLLQEDEAITLKSFLNENYGVIGRTASTKYEPNTSSKFQFWLSKRPVPNNPAYARKNEEHADTSLQERLGGDARENEVASIEIGNIVAALADLNDDITFGLVVEMRSYSDIDSFIADYLSHDFGDAKIEVPTDISEVVVVTCSVMRNVSARTKPVGRSRIYFPSSLGIEFAYGIVDDRGKILFSGAPIPVGVFENGDGSIAPIRIDEDFILGPQGAHLNVSGISGLASKTSAIQFITKSVLTHKQKRAAVVMFNVKSRDLLYVDQANPTLESENWSQKAYKELAIPIEPFAKARFFAPADHRNRPNGTQSLRDYGVTPFEWDLLMIYEQIPTLFNSMDWDDRMEGVWFVIQEEIEQGKLLTYTQMVNWVNGLIQNAHRDNNPNPRGPHIATWRKMLSHLNRFPRAYQGLIATAGNGSDLPWSELTNDQIFVIDIQMLNDRGQHLVFGRAINAISNMLESKDLDLDAVIVFVDELNKFAPSRNERSPLKSQLIDVTARGRGVGLILFGAEQFASSVDKEVVENSSTYLFGRTETNELRTANYSAFSDEVKTKLTTLPQGHLLIKFAKFPQPIFLRFPFPPCFPGDQFSDR